MFCRNCFTGMSVVLPPLHRSARLAPALYSASAKGVGSDCAAQRSKARCKYQVPASRLVFGVKKLVHLESGDLVFACPFAGRFFAHLHESPLSVGPMFSRVEAALAPNNRFYKHRVEMMFGCDQRE